MDFFYDIGFWMAVENFPASVLPFFLEHVYILLFYVRIYLLQWQYSYLMEIYFLHYEEDVCTVI